MNDIMPCMHNASVFCTFRQHATFEVFARAWHPLLPLLGQLSRDWNRLAKQHWREKMSAVERVDVARVCWPQEKQHCVADVHESVGFYRCLHGDVQAYIDGRFNVEQSLAALATCFLYNWPHAALLISACCKLHAAPDTEEQVARFSSICFRMATTKRSIELTELACELFVVSRDDVRWALSQMCAYGYKGIACYLAERYGCTVDDCRTRDNYALFYAIFNNHLPVVQWLLRMFPYTAPEVKMVYERVLNYDGFGKCQPSSAIADFVAQFLREQETRVDRTV